MTDPTTALATRHQEGGELAMATYSREQIDLLKSTIAKGASDMELAFFLEVAKRTGLSPFAKQLIFIKIWDKDLKKMVPTVYCTVDGLRAIADDSGEFDGMEGPWWKAKGGQWQEEWDAADGPPFAAKVLVYRKGRSKPFPGIVHYSDFVRKGRDGQPIGNWATQPAHMLRIRAETQALRVAFPQRMGGLFVAYDEETGEERARPILNPDGKASNGQLGELFRLARALGWDDDTRHRHAGVSSFAELTRQQAHELIEVWIELLDEDTPNVFKGPDVVDAELVDEPVKQKGQAEASDSSPSDEGAKSEQESAAAPDEDQRNGSPRGGGAKADRTSGSAAGARRAGTPPSRPAPDDPRFVFQGGPHKGNTFEQVAQWDRAYLEDILPTLEAKDPAAAEIRRVLADVGAAVAGRPDGADAPRDQEETSASSDVPASLAAAPADSEPGEVSSTPTAVDAEAPSSDSDVVEGELVEEAADWIEPHAFEGDDEDEACVRCGYLKEFGAHRFRGEPGDTHETDAAPEPAPDSSEGAAVGNEAESGTAVPNGEPERAAPPDLEDPVWTGFGQAKGQRFSQIAVEHPEILKEIAKSSGSGKRRDLANAWLQRTARERGQLV